MVSPCPCNIIKFAMQICALLWAVRASKTQGNSNKLFDAASGLIPCRGGPSVAASNWHPRRNLAIESLFPPFCCLPLGRPYGGAGQCNVPSTAINQNGGQGLSLTRTNIHWAHCPQRKRRSGERTYVSIYLHRARGSHEDDWRPTYEG